MPHHRTNRNKCRVHTDETEYLIWFNQYWSDETKRISNMVKEKRRGRKPKGWRSLKVEHKTIILNFD